MGGVQRLSKLRSNAFVAFAALLLSMWLGAGMVFAAEPDLKQAEALIRAGKAAEAYSLLEPFETQKAGDVLYDYLLATAALNSGQPSKASFIYERILAVQPNYVGVRADMGRAYFAMGDYARAKIEFESVIAFQNLPPDLKGAMQQYLSAIEQRQQGKKTVAVGYMEVGYGRDSNINSSTGQNPIELRDGIPFFLAPENLKTQARYWQVGLGGEVNHQLDDHFGLYGGADIRGRAYSGHSASNYSTLDGRAGVSYSTGANLLRTGLIAGRYLLDGNGTRDNYGITADWRHAVNNSNQLLVGGVYNQNRYIEPGLNVNDFDLTALNLGWTSAFANGAAAANATLSVGKDHAVNGRDDGDRQFYGLRVTLQTSLTEKVGGFVVLGWQKSNYDNVSTSFAVRRNDTLNDATIGLSWSFADRWTLRPVISLIKNKSNLGLNNFDRNDASITLRRDF